MRHSYIIILLLLFSQTSKSQPNYFNNIYNENNTWSISTAVIAFNDQIIQYGVTTDSVNGNTSSYIASINYDGSLQYWKTISDSTKQYWAGYSGCGIKRINDNGFISVGAVNRTIDSSNALLYRYNKFGDTLWTKQYKDPLRFLHLHDCNITDDGGFIMTGYQLIWGSYSDVLLIRSDSLGNELWRREYGLPGTSIEKGYTVVQTTDNGFLIGYYRYTAGYEQTGDPIIMKVDSLGNFEYENNLGGYFGDFIPRICLSDSDSYIVGVSISDSAAANYYFCKPYVLKFSLDGELIWEKDYTKTDVNNVLSAIYPDNGGGYIATGYRWDWYNPQGNWDFSYGWLLRIDENGDSSWYREYQYHSGTEHDANRLYDLCLTDDNGFAMVGQAFTLIDPQSSWVIKVDSLGCDTPGCSQVGIIEPSILEDILLFDLFPNPAITEITCRLKYKLSNGNIIIYNLLGREQEIIQFPSNAISLDVDITKYTPGLYTAVLVSDGKVIGNRKFVVR